MSVRLEHFGKVVVGTGEGEGSGGVEGLGVLSCPEGLLVADI